MLQQNNYMIFAKINIYNINIGKDKIEELNQNFQNLTEIIKHKSFRDTIEIEQLIIKVKTILNMIIDETKTHSKYELISNDQFNSFNKNQYFNSLKSALFFLEYLAENVIDKIEINKNIFDEYNNYINNSISELMPKLNDEEVKIYEWLKINNYINFNENIQLFSNNKLQEFYDENHRKIIDFILTRDIHDFYPYHNIGGIKAYLELSGHHKN